MRVRFDGTKDGPDAINFMGCLFFQRGKAREVDESDPELAKACGKLRNHKNFTILGAGDTDADIAEAPPMSPAVMALLEEYDIDPSAVEGSGKKGRIVKADVIAYIEANNLNEPDEEDDDENDDGLELDAGSDEDEDYD